VTTATSARMPKRKPPQEGTEGKQAQPKKTTTKVWAELLRKANMVALHKGIDLFDYVDAILRPAVEADYARMIQAESQGLKK